VVEGTIDGFVAAAPKGSGGFGYDPVFYIPDADCTMAELPSEVKNRISHRARAGQEARRLLATLYGRS
jgi:XTP/dITP diphosphohydrolase